MSQRRKGSVLLCNVVKVEDIGDPFGLCSGQPIPHVSFSNTFEFLAVLTPGRLPEDGTLGVYSIARQVLMDWNHQKIPYFSVSPAIHPSTIPMIPSTAGGSTVAPDAETVRQAQILTELSKPFELAGLFGAADAGVRIGGGQDWRRHTTHQMFAVSNPTLGLVSPSVRRRLRCLRDPGVAMEADGIHL